MQTIVVFALALVGIFLAVIMVLTILVARNLKAMAAAVAQASALVEAVEGQGGLPMAPARPFMRHGMKEIFAALPSLLKRADSLRATDAAFPKVDPSKRAEPSKKVQDPGGES